MSDHLSRSGSPRVSPGRALHDRFVRSEVSDCSRYYDSMNPAVKARWERIGEEWATLLLFVADVMQSAMATDDEYLLGRVKQVMALHERGDIPEEAWR